MRIPEVLPAVEVPLTPETPLYLKANGPCKIEGYDGDVARLHGFGSIDEKNGRWILQGPGKAEVPRWAQVHVDVFNGPSTVVGLTDGLLEITRANGPFAAKEVKVLRGETMNGPVSLRDVRDEIHLGNVHGPLRVEPCPKELKGDNVRGPVRIEAREPRGCRIVLRVKGPVVIRVPSDVPLHGRVQATRGIQVETDTAPTTTETLSEGGLAVATWQADDPSQALHLDIEVQGRVYIGPHGPTEWSTGMPSGFEWVTRMVRMFRGFGRGGPRTPRGRTPSKPAADLHEARKQVLRMLAEGKITVEQAEQLLRALEGEA